MERSCGPSILRITGNRRSLDFVSHSAHSGGRRIRVWAALPILTPRNFTVAPDAPSARIVPIEANREMPSHRSSGGRWQRNTCQLMVKLVRELSVDHKLAAARATLALPKQTIVRPQRNWGRNMLLEFTRWRAKISQGAAAGQRHRATTIKATAIFKLIEP